jgi:protein phosphatase
MSGFLIIGMTDPGRIRLKNEDNIATRPDAGLAVLADGMGGHQAGEVASRMAVEVITRHLTDTYAPDRDQPLESRIGEAIRRANQAIHEAAHSRPDYAGMGSTVVVALFRNGNVAVGHVGDSRLYRLRAGRLEQITEDHSVVQELVSRGLFTPEEARQSVGKNLVTRALGVDPEVAADMATHPLERDDTYLLCSDGLNDVVEDADIGRVIAEAGANLYTAAFKLVALANERGGPDNISVILIRRDSMEAQDTSKSSVTAADDDEFAVSRDDPFFVDDDKS